MSWRLGSALIKIITPCQNHSMIHTSQESTPFPMYKELDGLFVDGTKGPQLIPERAL